MRLWLPFGRKRPSHNLAAIDFHRKSRENEEGIVVGSIIVDSHRDLNAKLPECIDGSPGWARIGATQRGH